jgi:uncharacterized repeat protein (TIGR02543 family)
MDFTRTGYTFGGWKDSTGNVYAVDQLITNDALGPQVLDLYAQWSVNQYTLTLNGNGGTCEGDEIKTISTQYDNEEDISSYTYNRPGYTFSGWNTSQSGTGTPYTQTDQIRISGDITLYAQWKEIDEEDADTK